jgi:hypothetical protein
LHEDQNWKGKKGIWHPFFTVILSCNLSLCDLRIRHNGQKNYFESPLGKKCDPQAYLHIIIILLFRLAEKLTPLEVEVAVDRKDKLKRYVLLYASESLVCGYSRGLSYSTANSSCTI